MPGPRGWSRRDCLRLGGPAIGGAFAGCLSGGGLTSGTSTTQPTATSSTPSSTTGTSAHCAGSRRQNPVEMAVQYDTLSGFDLTANEDSVEQGESLVVVLENVTDTTRQSGNSSKYDVHRRMEDGWVSVFQPSRANDETPAFYSDAVSHAPGEGFRWDLTLTRDGLGHEIEHGTGYLVVCSPIAPGTYRFVYWGVGSNEENQDDPAEEYALGVQFTVTET